MTTGLNHLTLAVSDLDTSFRFYRDVVGLVPIVRWNAGAYFRAGEDWICLSLDPATRRGPLPEYTHAAFSVDAETMVACAERLRAHAVRLWKDNRSEGASIYFLDPDGHKLEFHVGSLESRLAALQERPCAGLEWFT